MTSIDRRRFVQDLASTPVRPQELAPAAGLEPAALDAIAGEDHVIQGTAEYEQLYDRLVAAERAPDAPRQAGELDRALAVYDAVRARRAPATPVPSPASAPRAPVILLPPPSSVALVTRSEYVATLGEARARELDAAARRHVTGPEADSQRRIRVMTAGAVEEVRALEARLQAAAPGSAEHRAIDAELESRVRSFESALSAERAALDAGRARDANAIDGITRRLPPYLRRSVEEQGLVVPGVPGAIAPRFSQPYGVDWRIRF